MPIAYSFFSMHCDTLSIINHERERRTAMMKLFVISACFGVFFSWTPALVDVYPTIASSQLAPISTHVTLLFLGSGISALAFWGKRPKIEE